MRSITRFADCPKIAFVTTSVGAAGTGRTRLTSRSPTSSTSCSPFAQAYSVEAGNVRHEHEWRVWKEVKLPESKILIPGVVSHATNVVEHPRLVADRITRFAQIVGRENVIASTDCGLGGRIHPQIAWAKLAALADGAKLATRDLWQ